MSDKAKEFLKKEFKAGRCKDITENPVPDFSLPFYDGIVKLMKRYAVYCEIEPLTELSSTDFNYDIKLIKATDDLSFLFQVNELKDEGIEIVQIINTMYGDSMAYRCLVKIPKI